jgi:hypothetical protein
VDPVLAFADEQAERDPDLAECRRRATAACEVRTGTTDVRLVVRGDGHVVAAAVSRSTVGERLTACTVRVVYRWRFPARASAEGREVITVPVRHRR